VVGETASEYFFAGAAPTMLGTAVIATIPVAATIAKSARRFQLTFAAMWNSFPSGCLPQGSGGL